MQGNNARITRRRRRKTKKKELYSSVSFVVDTNSI
jgi:hypothetical protein